MMLGLPGGGYGRFLPTNMSNTRPVAQELCQESSDGPCVSENQYMSLVSGAPAASCTLACIALVVVGMLFGVPTLSTAKGPHVSSSIAFVAEDAVSPDDQVLQSYARFRDMHSGRMLKELANGFANRPPADEWADRLWRGIEVGLRDPCSADVVSVMGVPSGFGSRVNSFINDLWVAVYNGWSIAICTSDDFVGDVWLKHFDNPLGIGMCPALVCNGLDHKIRHEMAWFQGFEMTEELAAVDHEYIDALKKFLTAQVYVMNEEVAGMVNENLRFALPSANLGAQQHLPQYVGVHVRHGDKVFEASLFPEGDYADVIRHYLLSQKNVSLVYVASDDPQSAPKLREQIEHSEGLAVVVEQQRLGEGSYASRVYADDAMMLALLVDIEAMRRAEVFIGTASSNLGRLIWCLRDPGRISFSLDFDNDFVRQE